MMKLDWLIIVTICLGLFAIIMFVLYFLSLKKQKNEDMDEINNTGEDDSIENSESEKVNSNDIEKVSFGSIEESPTQDNTPQETEFDSNDNETVPSVLPSLDPSSLYSYEPEETNREVDEIPQKTNDDVSESQEEEFIPKKKDKME